MGNHSCYVNKLPLCFVSLFLASTCLAQTYYTNSKSFGEADGFNITEGGYLSQDRKGFIWLASRNGLYRFNGTSFKHYKHIASDSFSLPGNQVNFCYEDKDGNYWVGVSTKGLYRFDDKTEKFTAWRNKNTGEIDMSQLYNVAAPFEDRQGQLWFSATTIGIVRINKKDATAQLFNVCDRYNPVDLYRSCRWVHHFSEDRNGCFWLCSNDGMIHFNPANGQFKVYRNAIAEVTCSYEDSQGQQWIGTWGGGLKKMDTTSAQWKEYKWSDGIAGTSNIISGIIEKDKDHLWISSLDAGLMIFDKRTGIFVPVASQNKEENYFKNAFAIFKDREENIWIEGPGQLGRINRNNAFQYAYLGNSSSKNLKTASCFLHLHKDSLFFIGTIYNPDGLHVYNMNTGKLSVIKLHFPEETEDINEIFADSKKQIWIATNNGIYIFDRTTLHAERFDLPSKRYAQHLKKSIVKIAEDKQHRLWFASRWHGLICFDPATKTTVHYSSDSTGNHHIPVDQVEYISFDNKGNLWAASHAYLRMQAPAFCLQTNGTIVGYEKSIPLNSVFQIAPSRGNKIIATTASAGLFEIDSPLQAKEHIYRYAEDQGVADSYLEGFAEDKKGNLWITTHNGLSCMTHGGQFINFHIEDGLANNKIEGKPYIDEEGNLFLPYERGFQFFNTDSLLTQHASVGPVILESLTINQKRYTANPNYLHELDLQYNENNLSFEFAALDLSQGDRLQYAYKLEGSDTKWNEIGTSRRLSFSNLSPGNYKLKLRAGDRFGNWSKVELVLPIIVQPPFWKTWWFYSMCALVFFALVYLAYRLRINRILAEQRLRNKIARDLHDDIGSTLSGIKLFSNMAQTKLVEENSGAVNIIERIGERSEKMIDAMSDIVWSINPNNDSIENMLVRMKQYAAEMMEPKNISYHFVVDEGIERAKIGLENRKDIYLIFKETINNAVKYSGCKNIRIEMSLHRKQLVLLIADDGIGFDTEKLNGNGNGVNNLKERAKAVGGALDISSKLRQGTTITLTVPVT